VRRFSIFFRSSSSNQIFLPTGAADLEELIAGKLVWFGGRKLGGAL